MTADFEHITAADLDQLDGVELDSLPFGVIGFDAGGDVQVYSATESRLAGLSADRVIGRHFFGAVAPCMNNFLVAQRFEDETTLDQTIDYVLTLRMRPTPVRLRMLKSEDVPLSYVLVQR